MFDSLVAYLQHSLIMCIDTLQCHRFHLWQVAFTEDSETMSTMTRLTSLSGTDPWLNGTGSHICRTEFRCIQFVGWRDWRCWMVGVPGVLSLVMKWQERNTLWSLWSKYICPSMAVQTSQLRSFLRIASHCLPECSENQWNQSGGVSFALVYGCVLCHSGWVKLNQTWRRLMHIKEIVLKVLKCGCFQK